MDKALLDYEVSIDADCKTLTVGKPFAIEGKLISDSYFIYSLIEWMSLCIKPPYNKNWFNVKRKFKKLKNFLEM